MWTKEELIESMLEGSNFNDFHSVINIKFGELIESGFDWGGSEYYPGDETFNIVHRQRINKKIEDRYYWREICVIPPGQFRHYMIRKLNEVMPKYNKMLNIIYSENFDILNTGTISNKQRSIFTEYPQSMLDGSQDYASTGNDVAAESVTTGDVLNKYSDFNELFTDVDVMILNELRVNFLHLTSLDVNAW